MSATSPRTGGGGLALARRASWLGGAGVRLNRPGRNIPPMGKALGDFISSHIDMGFIWDLHGISYGIYMGFIWDLHGISYGISYNPTYMKDWIPYKSHRKIPWSDRSFSNWTAGDIVPVLVEDHPTLGDFLSSTDIEKWCWRSPKQDIYQPLQERKEGLNGIYRHIPIYIYCWRSPKQDIYQPLQERKEGLNGIYRHIYIYIYLIYADFC